MPEVSGVGEGMVSPWVVGTGCGVGWDIVAAGFSDSIEEGPFGSPVSVWVGLHPYKATAIAKTIKNQAFFTLLPPVGNIEVRFTSIA
jgi:hypothetical protein